MLEVSWKSKITCLGRSQASHLESSLHEDLQRDATLSPPPNCKLVVEKLKAQTMVWNFFPRRNRHDDRIQSKIVFLGYNKAQIRYVCLKYAKFGWFSYFKELMKRMNEKKTSNLSCISTFAEPHLFRSILQKWKCRHRRLRHLHGKSLGHSQIQANLPTCPFL